MTTVEQMQAMTDRIIAEALEVVRAEAEQREVADHLRRTCDAAAEAARLARLAYGSPEMPGPGYDVTTRPIR